MDDTFKRRRIRTEIEWTLFTLTQNPTKSQIRKFLYNKYLKCFALKGFFAEIVVRALFLFLFLMRHVTNKKDVLTDMTKLCQQIFINKKSRHFYSMKKTYSMTILYRNCHNSNKIFYITILFSKTIDNKNRHSNLF